MRSLEREEKQQSLEDSAAASAHSGEQWVVPSVSSALCALPSAPPLPEQDVGGARAATCASLPTSPHGTRHAGGGGCAPCVASELRPCTEGSAEESSAGVPGREFRISAAAETREDDGAASAPPPAQEAGGAVEGVLEKGVSSSSIFVPSGRDTVKRLVHCAAQMVDREEDALERARISACVASLPLGAVDVEKLRSLAAEGLPSCGVIRALFWRIMLGCLSPNTQRWREERLRMRAAYDSYKKEFLQEPEAVQRLRRLGAQASERAFNGNGEAIFAPLSCEGTRSLLGQSSLVEDHPLNRGASSAFSAFFRDCDVFDQINKDVFRTRPELDFFSRCPRHTVQPRPQAQSFPSSEKAETAAAPQLVPFEARIHRSEEVAGTSSEKRGLPFQALVAREASSSPHHRSPAGSLFALGRRALLQRLSGDPAPQERAFQKASSRHEADGAAGERRSPSLESLVDAIEAALPSSFSQLVGGVRSVGEAALNAAAGKEVRRRENSRRDAADFLEDSAAASVSAAKSLLAERASTPSGDAFQQSAAWKASGKQPATRPSPQRLPREAESPETHSSSCSSFSSEACGCSLPPLRPPEVCDVVNPKRHADVLCRLLFIYAKLNPGILYVQGMNDLIAPIYVALMSDESCEDWQQAEAEVFFCFTALMQFQRDLFCEALDPTACGVEGGLQLLMLVLKRKAPDVWTHLRRIGIEAHFFALRWILLLLTQEFRLSDVLILWDAFIGDSRKPLPLVYYVCVALILRLRPVLLEGDFTVCMKTLQHLPAFDPRSLLVVAHKLRLEDAREGVRYEAEDAPDSALIWKSSSSREASGASQDPSTISTSPPSHSAPAAPSPSSLKQFFLEALPPPSASGGRETSGSSSREKSLSAAVVEGVREVLSGSPGFPGFSRDVSFSEEGAAAAASESDDALSSLRRLTFFAASQARQKAAELGAAAAAAAAARVTSLLNGLDFEDPQGGQALDSRSRVSDSGAAGQAVREWMKPRAGERFLGEGRGDALRREREADADCRGAAGSCIPRQPRGDAWLCDGEDVAADSAQSRRPLRRSLDDDDAETAAQSPPMKREVPITLL